MALSPGNHGVIVIHGIGDSMKAGDILADFTNCLSNALLESPAKDAAGAAVYPQIRRDADISADPASVTLCIKSPAGEEATWICKEAFWGDAFPPPKAATVVWWMLRQNMRAQMEYVWNGIVNDPANDETYMPDQAAAKASATWKAERRLANQFRFRTILAGLLIPPAAVFATLILFFIWISHWIPSVGVLDSLLKWVHKLDPFLSNRLGDVQKYVEHRVWSANARARLEKVAIDMLNDRFGEVKDVTIVAHSMGCLVAYDALAEGGRLAQEVARLEQAGRSKKITLVTVGSGINQVFRLARRCDLSAQQQFSRALAKEITGYGLASQPPRPVQDRFFWLDIYARRDPVPAGDLDAEIVTQAGVDPVLQTKRRKVINKDSLILDHVTYWDNKDIVMPRIARAINGGTDYPWPEAGITPEKLAHHAREAARFGLLTKITGGLIIAGLIVFVGLKLARVI